VNKKFIPGIYNYCDRWCERCTLASRCQQYEGNIAASLDDSDVANEKFWTDLGKEMAKAVLLLKKSAKKLGIDLDNIPKEESDALMAQHAFIKKQAHDHSLQKLSMQYIKTVRPFFKDEWSNALVNTTQMLQTTTALGISNAEHSATTIATISDCQQIIQWYMFFINAKLQRALQGMMYDDEDDGYPKDSDGSAKIAVIGIERSIAAWVQLYNQLPAIEDTALTALSLLQQMQQMATATFPNAMAFKRPGFDD
jgi:hypothetical protein